MNRLIIGVLLLSNIGPAEGISLERALDMLVHLTDWLKTNCNPAYLPAPNPEFNPNGPLPFGPYVPLEQIKTSLKKER